MLGQTGMTSASAGQCCMIAAHNPTFPQLSEEDMMSIYKLEMSFENSFASIPLMGAETNEIWDFISQSWNFRKVSHSFTSSLLTEAVELCLRRNLIFLQENSDFASLSIKDRKVDRNSFLKRTLIFYVFLESQKIT